MLSRNDGMPGVNCKLEIGSTSIYVKIACVDESPAYIDLTLGHEANQIGIDANKALLEVVCHQASALLAAKTWNISGLIDSWRGVRNCAPSGYCPQLKSIVSSPLDAVARWLDKRYNS